MGSVFTTLPDKFNRKGIDGRIIKYPQYLQFQPGTVVSVVHGEDDIDYKGQTIASKRDRKVGSIIAKPYHTERGVARKGLLGEEFRYYPLMRGIHDVPTVNDSVLLCTFGGINYYLGPLNTVNSPNFNPDPMDEQTPITSAAASDELSNSLQGDPVFQTRQTSRLHKKINKILDDPLRVPDSENREIETVGVGDLLFEGRHGNSIRIGGRNINPYIYISNGRPEGNIVESTLDGSLFAFTDRGTIRQHFPYDKKYKDRQADVEDDMGMIDYPFQLADGDDTETEPDKIYSSIKKTFAQPLGYGNTFDGEKIDINPVINEYSGSQAFLTSDRVTINARKNDRFTNLETGQLSGCMFMSAGNYFHLGSGNTMTFSTSNNMLMNVSRDTTINATTEFNVNCKTANVDGTTRINLGDPLKGDIMQPVAKGIDLTWMLKQLASDCMSLCDRTSAAIEGSSNRGASIAIMGDMKDTFKKWRDNIDTILSDKVYTK